ncbi:hypothetical protein JCM16303_002317 [Sporobolomyces ruberrimus]
MSAFTPYYSAPSARTSQSSSSSSSFSSTPAMSPHFSRRASYSSSEDSEDELETPNSSPQIAALDAKSSHLGSNGKGKGKALDSDDLDHINGEIIPFSLLEISEDDVEVDERSFGGRNAIPQPPTFGSTAPTSTTSSTLSLPHAPRPQPTTLVYPPGLPIPSSAFSTPQKPPPTSEPTPVTRTRPSEPSPPSRQQEEQARGRSRWPRILWSSELDQQSIHVLQSYHSRVVGGDLPVLKQGMSPRDVQKWSRKMEDAGL